MKSLKSIVKVIFILLGGYLFYRFVEPIDWHDFLEQCSKVKVFPVLMSLAFALWAYWLRALRWNIFLKNAGHDVPIFNQFYSISLGYFYNLLIPRMGEVVRCVSLSKSDNVPLSKVLATVSLDRLVDVIVLLSLIAISFTYFIDLFYPVLEIIDLGKIKFLLLALSVAIAMVFVLWFIFRNFIKSKFSVVLKQFKEGFGTINQLNNSFKFYLYTVLIWFCYYMMTYLFLLGYDSFFDFSFLQGFQHMVYGSLGMVAPSSGGLGTFHFMSQQALKDFNAPETVWYSIPFLMHLSQSLLIILLIFVLFIAKKIRTLKTKTL